MKNSDLTWIIREHVSVDRKPFSPDDLTEKTEIDLLPSIVWGMMQHLPKIDGNNYFDFSEEGHGFFAEVLDGDVQIYLMEWNGRLFFIDTQGYKYARYVGELV
jgi:hypothetical protein